MSTPTVRLPRQCPGFANINTDIARSSALPQELGDENEAMKATRSAFQELLDARGLDTPREVAMTDSVY